MKRTRVACASLLWAALISGCGSDVTEGPTSGPMGSIAVDVQGPAGSQPIAAIAIRDVFDPANVLVAECNEKPYPLPGDGTFCDSLLVLPPGLYEVVVQPADPSCATEQARYEAVVRPDATTELQITIVCGSDTGGVDVIVGRSYVPVIEDIELTFPDGTPANKYVCYAGSPVILTITVSDQDTACADLTHAWTAMLGTVSQTSVLLSDFTADALCRFSTTINPNAPQGTYSVTFWAGDKEGHSTSITFPIHVIPCP